MSSQEVLPRPMRLEEFTPHVNRRFVAECTPKEVELTLVEASPLKDRGAVERAPFILIFRSDPMAFLLDGMYVLRAASFEPAAVHIAMTEAEPGAAPGHYYQAVFN